MFDSSQDGDALLADFGVSVVWKGVSVQGIFDGPDQAINLGYTVMGNDYSVTFVTAELQGIVNGDPITVDGQSYLVRDTAAVDDGLFSRTTLKKV
jgi:hypothetical protein